MIEAVILAAGRGARLASHEAGLPKPLLPVGGRPLLFRVLDALAAAGVGRATVVLGHRGAEVRAAIAGARPGMQIVFVENPAGEAGNARSLWAAREAGPSPFLLTMADHLVEPELYRRVAGAEGTGCATGCAMGVEYAARGDARAGEATLVRVAGGRAVDVGKGLAAWDALDTGVFRCTADVFEALTPERRDGELSAVFAALARAGRLETVDVTGLRWLDVDTPEDVAEAERWFAADAPRPGTA